MAKLRQLIGAETPAEIKERLGLLQNAADSKVQNFESELKQRIQDPFSASGDILVGFDSGVHAEVGGGVNERIQSVTDSLFLAGDQSAKAQAQTAFSAIVDIVVGGAVGEATEKKSMISIVENGVPIALHMFLWKYSFSTKDIIGKTDNAVAYYVAKLAFKQEDVTKEKLMSVVSLDLPNAEQGIQEVLAAADQYSSLTTLEYAAKIKSAFPDAW